MKKKLELNEKESKVIKRLVINAAKREGEDVIGLMMKDGVFQILNENELVILAEKLEDFNAPIA